MSEEDRLNFTTNETLFYNPPDTASLTIQLGALIFLVTLMIIIFLASVVGNLFVFVVFYKRRVQLMTISNRFIINLSISSFLLTILVMPSSLITIIANKWYFGHEWCQITGMVTSMLVAACILTLLLISVDRYVAIISPLHYNMRFTTGRSSYMILGVWILSLAYAVPPILGWNKIEYQPDKFSCTVLWKGTEIKEQIYTWFITITCFVVPFLVIIWIYIVLYRAAKKASAKTRRNSIQPETSSELSADDNRDNGDRDNRQNARQNVRRDSSSSLFIRRNSSSFLGLRRESSYNSRRRSSGVSRTIEMLFHRDDWKAAKTGLVVITTFLLCWSPYFIVIVIESVMGETANIPTVIQCLVIWIALSASAINPIVYVFRSKAIRKELNILFQKRNKSRSRVITMRLYNRGSTNSDNGIQQADDIQRHSSCTSAALSTTTLLTNGSAVPVPNSVENPKEIHKDSFSNEITSNSPSKQSNRKINCFNNNVYTACRFP